MHLLPCEANCGGPSRWRARRRLQPGLLLPSRIDARPIACRPWPIARRSRQVPEWASEDGQPASWREGPQRRHEWGGAHYKVLILALYEHLEAGAQYRGTCRHWVLGVSRARLALRAGAGTLPGKHPLLGPWMASRGISTGRSRLDGPAHPPAAAWSGPALVSSEQARLVDKYSLVLAKVGSRDLPAVSVL